MGRTGHDRPTLLCSSVVERLSVKEDVIGSSPIGAANPTCLTACAVAKVKALYYTKGMTATLTPLPNRTRPLKTMPRTYDEVLDKRVTELVSLVNEVTEKHGDGTPFFDALDEALCEDYWYVVELNRYFELRDPSLRIVVSGKWGRGFVKFLGTPTRWTSTPLVLPGGLRHEDLAPIDVDLTGQRFVFLDDTCYKGRTRNKIRERIEEAGGELVTGLIIYDGAKLPLKGLYGLWRWHGRS